MPTSPSENSRDLGFNPCNEIELGEYELCNLREITFLDYFLLKVDEKLPDLPE